MPKTILLVEDDRADAEAFQFRLVEAGYTVALAGTGAEALAAAVGTAFDLIVMDIGLDFKDGIETVELLQGKCIDTPIVYLTNYGDTDTLDRAEKTKPYGYVLKSSSDPLVRISIANALARRAAEIELKRMAAIGVERSNSAGIVTELEALRLCMADSLGRLDQIIQSVKVGTVERG